MENVRRGTRRRCAFEPRLAGSHLLSEAVEGGDVRRGVISVQADVVAVALSAPESQQPAGLKTSAVDQSVQQLHGVIVDAPRLLP